MTIIRGAGGGDGFAQIRRAALQDKRLSYRARGILAAVMSRPDQWRTDAEQLSREGREGEFAVRGALQELQRFGYLDRQLIHLDNGWINTSWTISDDPQLLSTGPQLPRAGSPRAGSPRAGSPRAGSPRAGSPRAGSPRGGPPRAEPPRGIDERDTKRETPPPPTPSGVPSGDIDALVVVVGQALDGRAPKPVRRTLRGACEQLLAKGWTSEQVDHAVRTNDWHGAGAGAVARYLQDLGLQDPPEPARRSAPGPKHCGTCDPVTRMIEDPQSGVPRRCPTCHPLRKESA